MEAHNIDSILNSQKNEVIQKLDEKNNINDNVDNSLNDVYKDQESDKSDPYLSDSSDKSDSEKKDKKEEIDDYGNKIEKSTKMYSEEEVQNMIRDRLSRVKKDKPNITEKKITNSENDNLNNTNETWESEFKDFIDHHLEEKQIEFQKKEWQLREIKKQEEFEEKFTAGMSRYEDFNSVVQPLVISRKITDSMMLGIRNMENPASFIYTASKLHPSELDRISRIDDPYVQAAETGKLHERMIKDKKIKSSAPNPVTSQNGDLGLKNPRSSSTNINSSEYQNDINNRIANYAKQKRK